MISLSQTSDSILTCIRVGEYILIRGGLCLTIYGGTESTCWSEIKLLGRTPVIFTSRESAMSEASLWQYPINTIQIVTIDEFEIMRIIDS